MVGLGQAKMVSWDEVVECWNELQRMGLSLLIRKFVEIDRHRYMILVAPQVELAVDVDTTLGIPHRGGIKAVMEGSR